MTPLQRLSEAAKHAAATRRRLEYGNRARLPVRQDQILCFIEKFWSDRGRGPVIKEIQGAFDYASHSGFIRIIQSLERRGFIVRGIVPTSRISRSHETNHALAKCDPVNPETANVVQNPF
jgi:SOS-response transcriptional repressor LexA